MNQYGLIRKAVAAALIAVLAGCASAPARGPELAVVDQPALLNLAETDRLSLPAPLLAGGIWLEDRSLLVNRPFDMSLALTMPTAGPAIAAGVRQRGNNDRASQIAGTGPPDIAGIFCRAIPERPCHIDNDSSAELAVYALLHGAENGRLLTFVQSVTDPTSYIVVVSPLRPMRDSPDAWLADNASGLHEQLRVQTHRAARQWIATDSVGGCEAGEVKDWHLPALTDLSVSGCLYKQSPDGYRWIRSAEDAGRYALPGDATPAALDHDDR